MKSLQLLKSLCKSVSIVLMLKKLVFLFISLSILPVFADQYDNLMRHQDNFMVYAFSNGCGYCRAFKSNYEYVNNKFSQKYKFLKADGATISGNRLMRKLNVRYVPYVLLVNPNTKRFKEIGTACLLDRQCLVQEMNAFK